MLYCLSIPFIIVAIAAILLKIYIKLTIKWNNCYNCLVGKTALVTGANIGIGYNTALDFAKRGARVILACRNKGRAEDALRRIIKTTGNQNVTYKLVDFTSLQSVRDFAADINKNEERIDILVNNAGIVISNEEYTKDGIQTVLHVNHISPFLLTHLLIDKLKKSAPSRIVNVSSLAAKNAGLSVNSINKINSISKNFLNIAMYNDSKLCNILFTTELAKRLGESTVTVNAVHPGGVRTNILNNTSGFVKDIFSILMKLFFVTSEEGAQTQIYLSVSNDVAHITGGLFEKCKQIDIYQTAQDADLARKVWEKSEELAKLKDSEKISYL
ncbi:short chain dehydrogenase [Popillia japonica]|uniref:Short chain dehydrogenase n=1 Tax=Popillia japonica TaxID=7064 RepID=A0AAW1KGS7_POPJA